MSDAAALLGRVLLAALFLWSGYGKLTAPDATMASFHRYGLPLPPAAYATALVVELVVAALFVLGVRLRWTAFILAAWSIATALVAHVHFGDRAQMIQFMKNVAIAGGFLQVVAFGGGRYAINRH